MRARVWGLPLRRMSTTDPLLDPERHFLAVIQQVKDYAIFSLDLEGRCRSWNAGVERILGFTADEFVGHDVSHLIFTPEAQQDGVPQRELAQAATAGQANDDRWMRRRDGTLFYATGITTGLRNERDELIGYVKVMRDRTQWKQLQSQLQQTVDELARIDRHRSEFIAMLAHELRNPLAPLRHAVHMLPRVARDPKELASVAAMMERQVGHMGRLIDDLMDVGRLTQGRIELRRQLTTST
jgi:PAS domain S-box-containing protein